MVVDSRRLLHHKWLWHRNRTKKHQHITLILSKPQQQISNSTKRFRTISAGRRFGKSFLAINELAKFSVKPRQRCLYVAPTYRQAKSVIWDELLQQLYAVNWIKKVNQSDLSITLKNDSTITIRSSDNKDSLRGTKYNFIVLDECAFMQPDVWFSVLRPTLSDTGGHAMFITSPLGKNWIYDLWINAGKEDDWEAFSFSTIEGGWVPQSEIDAARRDLDQQRFEQEYEAKFVDTTENIFWAFTEDNIQKIDALPTDRTPLHIGMDFNNSPMSAVIGQKTATHLQIFDEIEIWGSNTFEMVQELRNRYGVQRQMFVYPDASGKARSTNSPGLSNHMILQNNGFKIVSDPANPPVAESTASVNAMLCNSIGERRLTIDPKCSRLREALIKHCYKPNTRVPDKDSGWDHLSDSLRYVTHKLFPMKLLAQTGAPRVTKMNVGRLNR